MQKGIKAEPSLVPIAFGKFTGKLQHKIGQADIRQYGELDRPCVIDRQPIQQQIIMADYDRDAG
ncbi:hypothetical protein D3C78_1865680 [compost metagenome]